MFICKDCHPRNTCSRCGGRDFHDFKDSYGRCEVCHESKGCADCNHHHVCPEIRKMVEQTVPGRPDLA